MENQSEAKKQVSTRQAESVPASYDIEAGLAKPRSKMNMIVRLWKTQVQASSLPKYEENERTRSLPMFKQQPGCLGALFLRSEEMCFALTFWKDLAAVERLKTSKSYLEAVEFYEQSGMLIGEPSLQLFEVKDGWISRGESVAELNCSISVSRAFQG